MFDHKHTCSGQVLLRLQESVYDGIVRSAVPDDDTQFQKELTVMVPSAAHKGTVVEVLCIPSEEAKNMRVKLERDAICDGWGKRACNGPSLFPLAIVTNVAPVVVVPVECIWIDCGRDIHWEGANLIVRVCTTVRTSCVVPGFSGQRR